MFYFYNIYNFLFSVLGAVCLCLCECFFNFVSHQLFSIYIVETELINKIQKFIKLKMDDIVDIANAHVRQFWESV
jgi:hypothetical protein